MTNTVSNVVQGLPVTTGGALIGTSSATLPASAAAATTGFTALGYIGDAGLTMSESRTTDKVKAWGSDVVKVAQSEHSLTYQFTLIESLNADVIKAIRGDANVTTTAATASTGTLNSVLVTGDPLVKLPWVFDMKDGDAKVRHCIPLGQVTAVGDVVYSDSGVAGYPVTLECFADDSGNKSYIYTDDGVFSA